MLKLTVLVLAILGSAFSLPASNTSNVDVRIIGGSDTSISQHPYQLALYSNRRFICGAVLIAHNWAITTAHCADGWQISGLTVRAGSTTVSSGGQVASVRNVIFHQEYNRRTLDYNFALLHLAGSVAVASAAPVRLADEYRDVRPGEWVNITGWGRVSVTNEYPEILQVALVPVVNMYECLIAYPGYILTDTMFCGGLLGIDGKDASHGDRGGPVSFRGELLGLISWALNHGSPVLPDVYASIPSVRGWIRSVTGI
ncbi:hypothetical protein NQ317_000960 [Molorchus minor]|uniref:Peptidase S1 domain-containing protein n=1 Tax=Molorchus minor TaxID=1323400 RepID=A0ABQ9IW06_9CUCU|nr:hypothetical protein NQ317_000960 [Molorchus minor]